MIKVLNMLIALTDAKFGKTRSTKDLTNRASYKLGLLDGYNEVSYDHKCDTADIRNWLGDDMNHEHYEKGRADIKSEINKISYKSDAKF